MTIIIIYVLCAAFVGWMGSDRTIGFWNTFLLSLILSPILGFIIVLFYPSKASRDRQDQLVQHLLKQNSPDPLIVMQERLEKIESMKANNLISEKEYDFMRKEVMAGK